MTVVLEAAAETLPPRTADLPVGTSLALPSFFLGGFECPAHRRPDGHRLDLLASTEHDRLFEADPRLLRRHGIATARDGLR